MRSGLVVGQSTHARKMANEEKRAQYLHQSVVDYLARKLNDTDESDQNVLDGVMKKLSVSRISSGDSIPKLEEVFSKSESQFDLFLCKNKKLCSTIVSCKRTKAKRVVGQPTILPTKSYLSIPRNVNIHHW